MNRKVLYGYQIEDGKLVPQPQEAAVVSRIFALCLEGKFQWEISDILNAEGIQYSPDCPAWTKFKISLTLRNQRYAGADGYPVLIGSETFQSVQALLQKKWGKHIHRDRPVSALRETLRCPCGGRLKRWFSSVHRPDTLYLRCAECGGEAVIPDAELLAEVERQAAEYTPPAEGGYTPSEDTVRLTNAINRGLERPEHPEDVVALILRGISARYACFEAPAASPDIQRLIRVKAYAQAIKYITITAENAVTVTFK